MKLRGLFCQAVSYLLLRHTPWNRGRIQRNIISQKIDRLHVGCGDILLKGWLNIRYEKREEYGRLKEINGALYLNYNLLKPWPVNGESVRFVAGSHFIEHLDLNDGIKFLTAAYKVLQKRGVIRLSCPDLELYARHYVSDNRGFFENKWIREWCVFKKAQTPGEIFIAKAYDSGGSHKWFYDFDSLKHILEAAGFKEIRKTTRLQGKTPDLEKLELPERELETVYVEGIKV